MHKYLDAKAASKYSYNEKASDKRNSVKIRSVLDYFVFLK